MQKKTAAGPVGYLKVANDLGMTKDAVMTQSDNAPRGIVAQLVYNSLEIDLMESTGNGNYTVQQGHNLLTDKLGYKYAQGQVTGIPGMAITHTASRFEADDVEIDSSVVYKVGNTEAQKFFGYQGEFYYKEKADVRTLVSFKPNSKAVEYVIEPDLIQKISADEIEYYPTDDAAKTEKISIKGAIYMYNGASKNLEDISIPMIGALHIIDNDADETADVIIVSDARVVVASAVDATKKLVYNEYNKTESLDLSGEEKDVQILKNGAEVQFSTNCKGKCTYCYRKQQFNNRQRNYQNGYRHSYSL